MPALSKQQQAVALQVAKLLILQNVQTGPAHPTENDLFFRRVFLQRFSAGRVLRGNPAVVRDETPPAREFWKPFLRAGANVDDPALGSSVRGPWFPWIEGGRCSGYNCKVLTTVHNINFRSARSEIEAAGLPKLRRRAARDKGGRPLGLVGQAGPSSRHLRSAVPIHRLVPAEWSIAGHVLTDGSLEGAGFLETCSGRNDSAWGLAFFANNRTQSR